ncbi:MAG: hypothetical protein JWN04_2623 [Myxococcaceae bacterium]|nr:hypothetical protein [Myxococcaceae bacterium]
MNKARCVVSIILMLAWHGSALAQLPSQPSEAQKNEASAHFTRGVALYQEQAFRAALVEFERAHEIAPDHRLLYNVGQAKLRLQDYLGAVQSYEAYLTEGGASVPPERRVQVEAALAELRERVGRLAISCNRDGAELFIDDVSAGTTPLSGTIPVNVGRHRVLARTPDGTNESRMVDVAGGDIAEVSLVLAEPRSELPTASAVQPQDGSMSSKKVAAIVSWSGGAAVLAAGAVTGALALHAQSDLDSMLKSAVSSPKAVSDKRDSLDMLALTTDVLIGVGAAALVAGTVLWLVDAKADKKDQARRARGNKLQVQFGPTAFGLRGSF